MWRHFYIERYAALVPENTLSGHPINLKFMLLSPKENMFMKFLIDIDNLSFKDPCFFLIRMANYKKWLQISIEIYELYKLFWNVVVERLPFTCKIPVLTKKQNKTKKKKKQNNNNNNNNDNTKTKTKAKTKTKTTILWFCLIKCLLLKKWGSTPVSVLYGSVIQVLKKYISLNSKLTSPLYTYRHLHLQPNVV